MGRKKYFNIKIITLRIFSLLIPKILIKKTGKHKMINKNILTFIVGIIRLIKQNIKKSQRTLISKDE